MLAHYRAVFRPLVERLQADGLTVRSPSDHHGGFIELQECEVYFALGSVVLFDLASRDQLFVQFHERQPADVIRYCHDHLSDAAHFYEDRSVTLNIRNWNHAHLQAMYALLGAMHRQQWREWVALRDPLLVFAGLLKRRDQTRPLSERMGRPVRTMLVHTALNVGLHRARERVYQNPDVGQPESLHK